MLLAALPATPVQLVHACYQAGYEVVVPASWGDELVAQAVLEDLQYRGRDPVIQCTCPHVRERLLASGRHLLPSMVQTAAPPVAAARYVRAAFPSRRLHITYLGACPGARSAAIHERYMPNDFLNDLGERGIVLADMPAVFDSVIPPDRRRFSSLPGGCPSQEALWQATDGRMLREVTQPTFATDLAQTLVWREHVMIDVATSLGCACSGSLYQVGPRFGRVAVIALEPPRADQPVVDYNPDFAALDTELPVPESRNGDTAPAPAQTPGSSEQDEQMWAPEPDAVDTTTPAVRARARKGAGLPRAYLAKRRHLAAYVPAIEQPVEAPAEEIAAAEPAHVPVTSEEPNEPGDVARQIDVHVEPEAQEFAAFQDEKEDEDEENEIVAIDFGFAATIEASPEHEMSEPLVYPEARLVDLDTDEPPLDAVPVIADETPAAARAVETLPPPELAKGDEPSVETQAPGEPSPPVDERPTPEPPPAIPLRVEVEIYEEPVEPSVAVATPEPLEERVQVREPAIEPTVSPARSWGDLLIALWLVLVASAVIASLLWRR